jgi:hypothetical protein
MDRAPFPFSALLCRIHRFYGVYDPRTSSGNLATFTVSFAPKCCGFLATPTNISRFDDATGLTKPGTEVEHAWALAGGLYGRP